MIYVVAPEFAIRGSHIVDEGDTVNLTCEVVAASPMTVAKWYSSGKYMTLNS